MIHQLPSGKTALFRATDQVPERLRRPVVALQMRLIAGSAEILRALVARRAELTEEEKPVEGDEQIEELGRQLAASDATGIGNELNDAMIVALVVQWEHDLPVTIDGVLDLPAADYDYLRKESAKHMRALMPDFSPSPDPASPTNGSEDSVTPSEPAPALPPS